MQYLSKSFTVPVSGEKTSQLHWDMIFLSDAAFKQKYGRDKKTKA